MNLTAERDAAAAGGIVGYSKGGEILNCKNTGDISTKGTTGGFSVSGGIGAQTHKDTPTLISNSPNEGSLTTQGYSAAYPYRYKGEEFAAPRKNKDFYK